MTIVVASKPSVSHSKSVEFRRKKYKGEEK